VYRDRNLVADLRVKVVRKSSPATAATTAP
jgi:hypothetical protein